MKEFYNYIVRSANLVSGTGNDFYVELNKPNVEQNLFHFKLLNIIIPKNAGQTYPSYFAELRGEFAGSNFSFDTRTKGSSSTIGFAEVAYDDDKVSNNLTFETVINFSSSQLVHFSLFNESNTAFIDSNGDAPATVIISFTLTPV